MTKRILESLEERRTQLKDEDKGFTLIELLVVVIIIGILVAIAIPVYIGLQTGAKEAATQSDLKNAKIAVVAYYTQNPTGTLTDISTLSALGYVKSADTTTIQIDTAPAPSSTTFCISATSSTTKTFSISSSGEVVSPSACP